MAEHDTAATTAPNASAGARALAVLKSGWPTILGAGLVAACVGFASTFFMTTRYEAEARVLVDVRDPAMEFGGVEIAGGPSSDPTTIANHVEMLRSRDVARHVVQRLELTRQAEFDPMVEGRSWFSTALSLVGLKRDLARMSPEERALEAWNERLSVTPIERTRVLSVQFVSRDADLAARAANAIVERYLDLQARAKIERDRRAIQHRQRRIEELRGQLADMAERIGAARARAGLPPLDVQGLPQTPLSETQRQIADIRREQDELVGRAGVIREAIRQGRPVDAGALAQIPALRPQAEALAAHRVEVDRQNEVLLPQHPRMRDLRAQSTDMETRLRAEGERLARAAETEAQRLAGRGEQLRRQIADATRRPGEAPRAGQPNDPARQLADMEREFQSQRELLESWVQMHRAATARDAFDLRTADARVLAQATPPTTPSEPRTWLVIGFAGLLGLLLSSAGVGLAALRTLRRPEDDYADLLAKAPERGPGEPVPPVFAEVRGQPASADAQAPFFSALAPRFADPKRAVRTLAFVSAGTESEGAVLAMALARKLTLAKRRVVLVDLDPEGEALARLAGLGAVSGLSDHLVGAATLGSVIHRDRGSKAHVVPSGRVPLHKAIAATGPEKLATTLAAFGRAYDHVVIDASTATHLPSFAGIDGVFLVAPRSVPPRDLKRLADALRAAGARSVDIVATGAAAAPERAAKPSAGGLAVGPRLEAA